MQPVAAASMQNREFFRLRKVDANDRPIFPASCADSTPDPLPAG
jgi:hypothetical protein